MMIVDLQVNYRVNKIMYSMNFIQFSRDSHHLEGIGSTSRVANFRPKPGQLPIDGQPRYKGAGLLDLEREEIRR